MNYYYINTEETNLKGRLPKPHETWFDTGFAFVSGRNHGQKLAKLNPDDMCFMYVNACGVMAVGRVLERWDGQACDPPLMYIEPYNIGPEYRIKVDWWIKLPHNPIKAQVLREIVGWTSPQTLQRIANHVAAERLCRHALQQASQGNGGCASSCDRRSASSGVARMQALHPIDRLFTKLKDIAPYPDGVVPVPPRLEGPGFFPGSAGLWGAKPHHPLPPMPMGGVMILGHDWGSECDYAQDLATHGELLHSPTSRTLLWLLEQVPIPVHACFFTNVYMGLRAGNAKITGRFPGARSPHFVHQCQTFLVKQIAAQRPHLIVTLGVHVPAVIAPLSAELAGWAHCKSFQALDRHGPPLIPTVYFPEPINVSTTMAALTHPSLWHRCVRERRYGTLQGKEAELQMLHEARTIGVCPTFYTWRFCQGCVARSATRAL
jgi:uracil-DNA glycosylase